MVSSISIDYIFEILGPFIREKISRMNGPNVSYIFLSDKVLQKLDILGLHS